jgi:hypothetical protein
MWRIVAQKGERGEGRKKEKEKQSGKEWNLLF